jgi:carbon-monoxide dehydrogenase medium subunit
MLREICESCRKLDALEDVHASSTYRQHLAAVLSRRALEQARDRIPPRTVGAKVA